VLVGRNGIVADICRRVDDGRVVLVSGPPGVGRSTILAECARRLQDDRGFHVVRISGVIGARDHPLSATAHLVDALPNVGPLNGASGDTSTRLSSLVTILTGHVGGGVLVVIDDVHEVDDVSLHAVATAYVGGRIRVLASTPTDATLATSASWLSAHTTHLVTLDALTQAETGELATGLMGRQPAAATIERIHQATHGVPRRVLDLVAAITARGGLAERSGLLHWVEPATIDTRLEVLIGLNVAALAEPDLLAFETLCLVGHMPISMLEAMHPSVDLLALEAARTIRASTRSGWLMPQHPLLRDVTIARMAPLRHQLTVRRVLRHWRAHPPQEPELDRRRVMLACDHPDTGGDVIDGHEVDTDAVVRWAMWGRQHGAGFDMLNVAAHAWARQPSADAGLAYAAALNQSAQFAEADRVLVESAQLAEDDTQRVNIAMAHADVVRHGLTDPDRADRLIRSAQNATESEAERLNLAAVAANDQLLLGSFAETVRLWRSVTAGERGAHLDDGVYRLTQPAIIALATAGLVDEAATAYRTNLELRPTSGRRHPLVGITADLWWAASTTLAGAGHLSADLIDQSMAEAVAADNSVLRAIWALPSAMQRWLAGDLVAADRLAREAMSVPPGLDEVRALAGFALIRIQLARGLAGDASDTAGTVIGEGSPTFQAHATWLRAAEAQLRLMANGPSVSVSREVASMLDHAAAAQQLGQLVPAAYLLHDALRLRRHRTPVAQLVDLAARADAPVVHVLARHAERLIAGDAYGLRDVAAWAEQSGLRVVALACLDDAARHSTSTTDRAAAAAAVAQLRSRCTGLADVAARTTDGLGLTRRERQVAAAASTGLTDREIAAVLVVSVRTVNAQLRSAYAKLGVEGRRALRHIPELHADAEQFVRASNKDS
jgi:DNA-binding CsgD family transcriptional regulator